MGCGQAAARHRAVTAHFHSGHERYGSLHRAASARRRRMSCARSCRPYPTRTCRVGSTGIRHQRGPRGGDSGDVSHSSPSTPSIGHGLTNSSACRHDRLPDHECVWGLHLHIVSLRQRRRCPDGHGCEKAARCAEGSGDRAARSCKAIDRYRPPDRRPRLSARRSLFTRDRVASAPSIDPPSYTDFRDRESRSTPSIRQDRTKSLA